MAIIKCRVCKGRLLKIGSVGNVPLSDFTDKPKKAKKYPIELVYCKRCTLVQLAHNTPRDLMYKNYWYKSDLNKAIIDDLKEIAKYGKGVHIDIGCNDGTLLRHSKARYKIGVDPSNIKPIFDGTFVNHYWEDVMLYKANVITAIACLYDLPDPNAFMENVKRHLKRNGVFISQFQSLNPMIELNDVGNICHEHLEYYSYKSLVYLFENNGLEIYRVERNKINGGSYRVFARHYNTGSIKFDEPEYELKELRIWFDNLSDTKNKFRKLKLPIVGYGASTKAGTMVAFYGIKPSVVVDVNPRKLGKYTNWGAKIVGKIPKGTKYLWVFPYGFLDYFKEKEHYKGKWVVTSPNLKIS